MNKSILFVYGCFFIVLGSFYCESSDSSINKFSGINFHKSKEISYFEEYQKQSLAVDEHYGYNKESWKFDVWDDIAETCNLILGKGSCELITENMMEYSLYGKPFLIIEKIELDDCEDLNIAGLEKINSGIIIKVSLVKNSIEESYDEFIENPKISDLLVCHIDEVDGALGLELFSSRSIAGNRAFKFFNNYLFPNFLKNILFDEGGKQVSEKGFIARSIYSNIPCLNKISPSAYVSLVKINNINKLYEIYDSIQSIDKDATEIRGPAKSIFCDEILYHAEERSIKIINIVIDKFNVINPRRNKIDDKCFEEKSKKNLVKALCCWNLSKIENKCIDFAKAKFNKAISDAGISYIDIYNIYLKELENDINDINDFVAQKDHCVHLQRECVRNTLKKVIKNKSEGILYRWFTTILTSRLNNKCEEMANLVSNNNISKLKDIKHNLS